MVATNPSRKVGSVRMLFMASLLIVAACSEAAPVDVQKRSTAQSKIVVSTEMYPCFARLERANSDTSMAGAKLPRPATADDSLCSITLPDTGDLASFDSSAGTQSSRKHD
jgi:hypothetical protein